MGSGTSAYNRKISATLKNSENGIRNNRTETLIAIDAMGNQILNLSQNKKDQVAITPADGAKMRGAIVTHNHPGGTTFSYEDIDTSFKLGVKEMRACHANGFYSLKRTFELGTSIPDHYKTFANAYRIAYRKYKRTNIDPQAIDYWNLPKADRKKLKARLDKEWSDFRRDWLKKNAEHYGWKYSEGGK